MEEQRSKAASMLRFWHPMVYSTGRREKNIAEYYRVVALSNGSVIVNLKFSIVCSLVSGHGFPHMRIRFSPEKTRSGGSCTTF